MAASWITGQGVSSRSSHSAAAGRTTFSAKPWTQSRMSFWSWFSSSEKRGAPCSSGPLPLVASATISFALWVSASAIWQ